jgi:branched-chain amino acid transport system substrate-binding protein
MRVLASARRRSALLCAVVLVAGAPLLAGCIKKTPSAKKMPASVLVGLLAPTSGFAAAEGRSALQGAELAVEVINAAHPEIPLPFGRSIGLTLGTKVKLVSSDTGGSADGGVQAADQVVQSNPSAVVVADSALVVKAVSERTEAAPVSLVDASSSADFLGELGRESYFRMGPTDRMYLSTAFDVLRQGPGIRRILVLDGASLSAVGGPPEFTDFAQSRGFAVMGRLPVTPAIGSAAELADKVSAQKPDSVIALVGTPQEAAVVADMAQRLKVNAPVVTLGNGLAGLAAGGAGPAGRGVLRVAGWSDEYATRNPAARAVGDLYQRRYGTTMTDSAARAFTAVMTVAVAVDRAGTTDVARVRATLSQTQLQATETIMPWNGVKFDTNGQNLFAAPVVEQRFPNGFQVVYPRELAPRAGAS